jgi:hypothetical protein
MSNSPLEPGESNCALHSDLDGTYVCSVRSNGSVNDETYNPETHLACVTSGEGQYCANIGISDSDPMMPGGGPGPGPDDMAPPQDGKDMMPDEDMPVLDDEEEPDQQGGGGGTPPDSAIGLMPNQGGGEKCPRGKPKDDTTHCGGWVPLGAIEASCYYSNSAIQRNCALQDGDDMSSSGWICKHCFQFITVGHRPWKITIFLTHLFTTRKASLASGVPSFCSNIRAK